MASLFKPQKGQAAKDSPADQTRTRLLQNALKLFASEGIKGVSLRRIVLASGTANPSALHYHFGNRWALVTEIAEQIHARLREKSLPRLAALTQRPHQVLDVLHAVYQPVLALRENDPMGRHAVQFLARLPWELGPEGQALSAAGMRELFNAALALLTPLLPGKQPDEIRLHLLMSMTNVYHGLADFDYLHVVDFGPSSLLITASKQDRLNLFFGYIEAGMQSTAPEKK